MQVVSLKGERLWCRGLRKLLDVVLSEFVLYPRFFQENGVRLDIKDSVVIFTLKRIVTNVEDNLPV
jgi:hypothetical protein